MKSTISLAATCIMLTASGCASHSQVKEAMSESDQAKRIAEQALNTANEAREIAKRAEARSSETEIMINRSFKKSMYK